MAHELEKMIYVGETPWHGLGMHLAVAPASTAEAVRLAGLDWQIALEQLQLADGTLVDRNAVVRQSDRAVLGTVGMGWEPVQNIEAFSPIEPFLSAGLATVETAGSLRGGRRVWMLAKVARPDSVIVPQADDRVAKYMLAAIGHDGTMAFRFGYSPTRVVCMNTLSVAIREGESTHVRIPHFSGIKKAIEAVSRTIEEVDARFEKTAEIFRALAAVKVKNAADLRQYVETVYHLAKPDATPEPEQEVSLSGLLQKPRAAVALPSVFAAEVGGVTEETRSRVYEEIARLFEFGKGNRAPGVVGTAWAAYNAVTEYNTWQRGGSQDTRLMNVWMRDSGVTARALPAAVAQFLEN